MKILGIDTTTKFLSIGIFDDGRVFEYNLELFRMQSSFLLPTIKRILSALKWDAQDLDYLACGLGPGSFTGIRLGLSTVKGLAFGLNKPVIGVSSLDIIALNAQGQRFNSVYPVLDAKRGLIFCSAYKIKAGNLSREMPYMLLKPGDFIKKINPDSAVLGDALDIHKTEFVDCSRHPFIMHKDYWYPAGRNIIKLALEKLKRKEQSNCFDIEPVYLYPDDCQVKPKS